MPFVIGIGAISALFGGAWLVSSTTKLVTISALIAGLYFILKGGF